MCESQVTRADEQDLLRLATQVPLRPKVTPFPLAAANVALQCLKAGQINGSGVLVM